MSERNPHDRAPNDGTGNSADTEAPNRMVPGGTFDADSDPHGNAYRDDDGDDEVGLNDPDASTAAKPASLLARFPALLNVKRLGSQRRVPYVQQTAAADCGPACLTMVLAYYGKQINLDEVRNLAGVGSRGADALTLLRVGRWYGLRGRGVKVEEIDDLQYLDRASILHWGFQHFVVFEAWDGEKATIVDPSGGRRKVSKETLRRQFTGVALVFDPSDDFEPEDTRKKGLWRYLSQILAQSGVLSRVIVTSVLVQLFALALPILTGLLVDRVVPRGDTQLLLVIAAGLVGIVGFQFVTSLIRSYLLLQLRTQLDARLTLDFLDHLVDLPYAYFQQRSAGDLLMRLNSNSTIREILTTGTISGILDGFMVVLYLVVLYITSTTMATVVLGLGLLRVIIFLLTRRKQRDLMSEALQAEAKSRGYQVQLLTGIETLKASGTEKRSVELWSNLFVDELNVIIDRGRLNALIDSSLSALATGSPLLILVVGGFLVLNGELTLGTMLAANALAGSFLAPLTTLVGTATQLQLMGSYLDRINDVLDTPKEQDREEVTPAGKVAGQIRLEGVSFRYNPMAPMVVRDVALKIEPGDFVAIVGRSGSGKSTLANLLLGLFIPTSGKIYYDGVDLERLEFRSVRSQLGIVSQQPYLFGTSIRANIAMADPTLPLDRVMDAARLAYIHDDIMALPMGYETLLADGGTSLSGGQRQRIALARALVHKPAILLLDEATSALDAVTEASIHAELQALRCTRIVIAHRLSTVRRADLILVMHEGEVVEQGTHEELLERGDGHYSRLVAAQLSREDRILPEES